MMTKILIIVSELTSGGCKDKNTDRRKGPVVIQGATSVLYRMMYQSVSFVGTPPLGRNRGPV
eukprot:1196373-Prorocentrum_minimum.AAC.8